jgi:hypothetical protein
VVFEVSLNTIIKQGKALTTTEPNKKSGPSFWAFLPLVVFILGVLWLAAVIITKLYGPPNGPGIFGDMFGGVNALFSGLAFAGVIFPILLQRKELQLQREELKQTREELKGQKEQLRAQNETFQKQSFENTFFSLLGLHNDTVNRLNIRGRSADASATITGRNCFARYYEFSFRGEFGSRLAEDPDAEHILLIDQAYQAFLLARQSELPHYFRGLYHIITFVKNSDIDNKVLYTNTVRAQLSNYELLLLFYNYLSGLGREKFKPLVEEFALLKNVPIDGLMERSHEVLYEPAAFGKE